MSNLTPYIKLDDVIYTSRRILQEINPQICPVLTNNMKYCINFADMSDVEKINNTFNGLIATGYHVLTSKNKELIRFNFENDLELDFKYSESYSEINYNPITELISELQLINCNLDEISEYVGNMRI